MGNVLLDERRLTGRDDADAIDVDICWSLYPLSSVEPDDVAVPDIDAAAAAAAAVDGDGDGDDDDEDDDPP